MALADNEYYFVQPSSIDGDGATVFMKGTLTSSGFTAVQVPAEEAAPWLIDRALRGEGFHSMEGAYRLPPDATSPEIASIEATAVEVLTDPNVHPGLTQDSRYELIHRALGDNPTVIKVGYETLGADVAARIWPAGEPAITANSTESANNPQPSPVIQNSQTQGVGPVARIGTSDRGGAGPTGSGKASGPVGGGSGGGPAGTGEAAGHEARDTHGQGTASSPRADPRSGGDPILLASGQLYQQVTDLEVRGRGIHFAFTRTYFHQTNYRGPMGFSWDHGYNLWLREAREIQPDGSFANVVYRSNGQVREDRYTHVLITESTAGDPLGALPDATFRGPAGFFDELTKTASIYRLQMVNGTLVTYNADLQVETISDTNGNSLSFVYQDRVLVRVIDAVDRNFDFVNDECGRVVKVIDQTGGRQLRYTYDDIGNLIEADIFADEATAAGTDYLYLGMDGPPGMEHNLVEVIGADGNSALLVTYGTDPDPWSYNRVVEQRANDGLYQYQYGFADFVVDPDLQSQLNLPRNVTTITYPNGHVIEHAFNAQGNVVRRREEIGGLVAGGASVEELVAQYLYNADGLLVHEERPDGATVSYLYQVDQYEKLNGVGTTVMADSNDRLGFGNLLRRAETARAGTGETRQLITTWTYVPGGSLVENQRGPFYADPTGVELPGQATPTISYFYDARRRLARIDYGPVQTADGGTQALPSNHFSYDVHGSLTDLSVGTIRTHYDYFPDEIRSGYTRRRVEDADGLARGTTYELDNLGRLIVLRDSLGAETRWEYNGFDLPVNATLPQVGGKSPEINFLYDRARRVNQATETIVNADGTLHADGPVAHKYRYDPNGRVIEVTVGPMTVAGARSQQTVYTPWGQPRRIIDSLGVATDIDYDARNLPVKTTYAKGTPSQGERYFRYNHSGELSATVDELGNERRIVRDGFGRERRLIDRDGNAWETDYDAQDRPIRRRLFGPAPGGPASAPNIMWSEARQEYDAVGRIIRRVQVLFVPGDNSVPPREIVARYFYDEFSRLKQVIEGTVTTHKFSYDGLGRLTEAEDADGNAIRTLYDDAGHRIVIARADQEMGASPPRVELFRSIARFNLRGLTVEETDTIGNTTTRDYDSRGLTQEILLPNGRAARYSYDLFGQPVQQKMTGVGLSAGIDARSDYDALGRLTALVTPGADRFTWTYDARGRLTATDGPHGARAFTYDAAGRLVLHESPSGLRTRSNYSPEGRMLSHDVDVSGYIAPAGAPGYMPATVPLAAFTYTPAGSLLSVEEGARLVKFEYDSLGRILRETNAPDFCEYTWDDAGRRSGFVFPGGRSVGYRYSLGGFLTGIDQIAPGTAYPGDPGAAAARTLIEIGRVGARSRSLTVPGIVQAVNFYDAAGRLVGIDYSQAGASLERLRTLHGAGKERLLDDRSAGMREYIYDAFGRLRRAEDHPSTSLSVMALAPATNEPALGAVVTQAAIGALAQSTAAAAGPPRRSFEYTLDAAGNRISSSTVLTPGGAVTMVPYNPAPGDRYGMIDGLTTVYDLDGNLISDGFRTFHYDVLGRLRVATDGAVTTAAGYDPLGRLAALESGGVILGCRWAGTSLVEIDRGADRVEFVPGDRVNSPAHVAAGGRDIVPMVDDVGTVVGWAGAGGIAIGLRQYDPFGRLISNTGLDPAPLGFAGYLLAPHTDLNWLLARVYDARLGRFLQPDPMDFVDGLNVYVFAHNAPGTFIDALGFQSSELDWGTVAWEGTKTLGGGLAIAGAAAGLVAAGVVTAPVLLALGAVALAGMGVNAYLKRSDDALAAGKTDVAGSAALAALGDVTGISGIYEGATGQDAITDRVLGGQERSERLGKGIGTVGTLVLGPKAFKLGSRLGSGLRAPVEGFISEVPGGFKGGGGPPPELNPFADLSEAEVDAALDEMAGGQYYRTPVTATEGGAQLESLVPVSRWGKPGLRPNDWIVPGRPGWPTYLRSFKFDPFANKFAPPGGGQGFMIPPENIGWPRGWGLDGAWKGLYGQRRYYP